MPKKCQVVSNMHFPCGNREGGGYGYHCERLDPHNPGPDCWISDHTIQHATAGNGYACSAIEAEPEKYPVPELQIVTICGSMRFFSHMVKVATVETELGNLVLCPFSTRKESSLKGMLDFVHKHKINMADRVIWVTNHKKYLGKSTRRELKYARDVRRLDISVYEFQDHSTWTSYDLPEGFDLDDK